MAKLARISQVFGVFSPAKRRCDLRSIHNTGESWGRVKVAHVRRMLKFLGYHRQPTSLKYHFTVHVDVRGICTSRVFMFF